MKYIRQTLAALVVVLLCVLLAFGLKATPLKSLFADGGGDRGAVPAGQQQRGDHGPRGDRYGSFSPANAVGTLQSVVPQALIIGAIATFEKRRRQRRSAALRGNITP